MTHSALQAGQYSKWRTGVWTVGNSGETLVADFTYKTAWDLERLSPNNFFPIPASVVFAKRIGVISRRLAKPLTGNVERWRGSPGSEYVQRDSVPISDVEITRASPYVSHARQGASIVPRCMFFVSEVENPALVQAGQTVTVNPRRGGQNKEPWKSLDLTAITGQTVESAHLFDVHLGETLVPYATLDPLKALLPLRQGETSIPAGGRVGGIRLDGLARRMRGRWRTISRLWDEKKAEVNRLNLLGRLDYNKELSAQLVWQECQGGRPVRVVYSSSGEPTAALVANDNCLVDYTLFWLTCADGHEANYLLAIINSNVLYGAVSSLMPKGLFGARHVHKHLWKLPIPEFDAAHPLHLAISKAGEAAAAGAAKQLEQLRQDRPKLTVTIARRELRKWLRASAEGKAVEEGVGELLGAG